MEELMLLCNRPLAQLTAFLGILVSSIYLWKRIGKSKAQDHWCNKLNKGLRKVHLQLSIAFILAACLHVLCVMNVILQCPLGLMCIGSIVLIGITSSFMKKGKTWHFIHCLLTLIFVITLILHIGEVRSF